MTTGSAGLQGFAPTVKIEPYNPQKRRYERVWEHHEYRAVSPGEKHVMPFLACARPEREAEVIDFGCGTGRAALLLAALGGLKITLVDFAGNCLDDEVRRACVTQPDRIKFHVADLTLETLPFHAAYGYCTDMLEHVETADVPTVIRNILSSAQHCFFSIGTFADVHGPRISDGPLHLTVRTPAWWLDRLRECGAVIHWWQEGPGGVAAYCTAWKDAADIIATGRINTDEATVDAQVRANVEAGWQHIQPHDTQPRELILLAGGPSMNEQLDKIRELRESGCGLVTVNGAYGWALEHGLEPSVQIVLDARAWNARFTKPVTPYTKYLIASQCHPTTLEGLPRERTWLWHSGLTDENEALVREKTGNFFPIPGGSTVVLRSLALLRMMGFKRLHLFGFDSCVRSDGSHHAYAQPENDRETLVPVVCGGRTFQCTPWMLAQASEFRDVVGFMGDEIECAVYGDGLIAQMIETCAGFSLKEA